MCGFCTKTGIFLIVLVSVSGLPYRKNSGDLDFQLGREFEGNSQIHRQKRAPHDTEDEVNLESRFGGWGHDRQIGFHPHKYYGPPRCNHPAFDHPHGHHGPEFPYGHAPEHHHPHFGPDNHHFGPDHHHFGPDNHHFGPDHHHFEPKPGHIPTDNPSQGGQTPWYNNDNNGAEGSTRPTVTESVKPVSEPNLDVGTNSGGGKWVSVPKSSTVNPNIDIRAGN